MNTILLSILSLFLFCCDQQLRAMDALGRRGDTPKGPNPGLIATAMTRTNSLGRADCTQMQSDVDRINALIEQLTAPDTAESAKVLTNARIAVRALIDNSVTVSEELGNKFIEALKSNEKVAQLGEELEQKLGAAQVRVPRLSSKQGKNWEQLQAERRNREKEEKLEAEQTAARIEEEKKNTAEKEQKEREKLEKEYDEKVKANPQVSPEKPRPQNIMTDLTTEFQRKLKADKPYGPVSTEETKNEFKKSKETLKGLFGDVQKRSQELQKTSGEPIFSGESSPQKQKIGQTNLALKRDTVTAPDQKTVIKVSENVTQQEGIPQAPIIDFTKPLGDVDKKVVSEKLPTEDTQNAIARSTKAVRVEGVNTEPVAHHAPTTGIPQAPKIDFTKPLGSVDKKVVSEKLPTIEKPENTQNATVRSAKKVGVEVVNTEPGGRHAQTTQQFLEQLRKARSKKPAEESTAPNTVIETPNVVEAPLSTPITNAVINETEVSKAQENHEEQRLEEVQVPHIEMPQLPIEERDVIQGQDQVPAVPQAPEATARNLQTDHTVAHSHHINDRVEVPLQDQRAQERVSSSENALQLLRDNPQVAREVQSQDIVPENPIIYLNEPLKVEGHDQERNIQENSIIGAREQMELQRIADNRAVEPIRIESQHIQNPSVQQRSQEIRAEDASSRDEDTMRIIEGQKHKPKKSNGEWSSSVKIGVAVSAAALALVGTYLLGKKDATQEQPKGKEEIKGVTNTTDALDLTLEKQDSVVGQLTLLNRQVTV